MTSHNNSDTADGDPRTSDDQVPPTAAGVDADTAGGQRRESQLRPRPHRLRHRGMADPALVELVLSSHESLPDRCRALRLLGLSPRLPLRVAAVAVEGTRDPTAEALALATCQPSGDLAPVGVIGDVAMVLFDAGAGNDSPAFDLCKALRHKHSRRFTDGSLRVGLGGSVAPTAAEKSWEQAVLALRFAAPAASGRSELPVRPLVDYDKLGAYALLAKIPRADLRSQRDVVALDALASSAAGALEVAALQAFCRTGSLRSAAQALYVHHSTVADRLARAAGTLGWHLDDPADRFRAQLALCARRLADSPSAA
jgi:sugar diacid utilization regulator